MKTQKTPQRCLSDLLPLISLIALYSKKKEDEQELFIPYRQNDGHGMVGMRIKDKEYMSFTDQEKKCKRQPIRSKRKIGRNEPCPCGRYKMVEGPRQFQEVFMADDGVYPMVNPLIKRRLKYKNCCGHIDSQRATFMAKHHILSFVRDLFYRPAKREGLIGKFKNLFGRKHKINRGNKYESIG